MSEETEQKYIQTEGVLFEKVQSSKVFKDSKTFVDSRTKLEPSRIIEKFSEIENNEESDLESFLENNFDLPDQENANFSIEAESMEEYIQRLWRYLTRTGQKSSSNTSTLIPLKNRYVVPGGAFP